MFNINKDTIIIIKRFKFEFNIILRFACRNYRDTKKRDSKRKLRLEDLLKIKEISRLKDNTGFKTKIEIIIEFYLYRRKTAAAAV